MKENDGKVRVVFKNMIVHPKQVTRAHLAGCAAALQGKFVAFKDNWWELAYKQHQTDDQAIERVATAAGLDVDKLKKDMESDACKQRIDEDMAQLRTFGVNGTPSFFINGTHSGAMDKAGFQRVIDGKLKEVDASGVPPADYYDRVIMKDGEKKFRSKKDPKPT